MSEQETSLDEFISGEDEQTGGQERDQHLPEIDEIPKDWSLVTVEDVADDLVGGGTPSKSNDDYWGGDIPWVSVKDLNGIELSETEDYITEAGVENSATNVVPADSIIVSTRMTVGEPFLNKVDMAINQDMKAIIPDTKRTNSLFLVYSLWDKDPYLKSLGRGTTVDGITTRDLLLTHLGLPPLEEQHKIASVLYTVDQAIQKTEEIAEQANKVLGGLMDDIFEQGYDDHESYQDTPVGRYPSTWEMVQLEKLLLDDMSYGILKPGDYDDDGVPMIRATDIDHGRLVESHPFKVSQSKADEYERTKLAEKDVILSVMGTVGRSMCVPASLEGANLNRALARLRFDQAQVIPEFIEFWFRSPRTQSYFETQKFGTAQPRLNLGFLNKMKVPVPPIDEQKRIVEVLYNADSRYWEERETISQLQRLKQGLMQDLLSGKVRTHDKDIEIVDEVLQHG